MNVDGITYFGYIWELDKVTLKMFQIFFFPLPTKLLLIHLCCHTQYRVDLLQAVETASSQMQFPLLVPESLGYLR